MIKFKKARRKPEAVEAIEVTQELVDNLISTCNTQINFCPASNKREEQKETIIGNSRIVFYPDDFGEYGKDMSVYSYKGWKSFSIGDYLVKTATSHVEVVPAVVFSRFYEMLEK